MDIRCPRCGNAATPAGHEDGRAFYQCEKCNRVWMTHLATATTGRLQPTRVLVVDDSDQLVQLISAWLEDEGYQVASATTGKSAIEIAEVFCPDIVMLDVIIPAPDGFAVCQMLWKNPKPPLIILITGTSDPHRLLTARQLDVFALLMKPLNEEGVLDVVSRARRRRWEESHTSPAVS